MPKKEKQRKRIEYSFHTHYRVYDITNISESNPSGMQPKGGVTVAAVKYINEKDTRFNYSVCSKNEVFCKEIGRSKAYARCDAQNTYFEKVGDDISKIRKYSNFLAASVFKEYKLDVVNVKRRMSDIHESFSLHIRNIIRKAMESEVDKVDDDLKEAMNKVHASLDKLFIIEE